MKVGGKEYRTVWMEDSKVCMIEQNKLPFEFEIVALGNYKDTCKAIKDMTVRGAGAIGATAGFAMAQAFDEVYLLLKLKEKSRRQEDYCRPKDMAEFFLEKCEEAKKEIEATRPTAQNLFYATNRVFDAAKEAALKANSMAAFYSAAKKAADEAQKIADEDEESGRQIGIHGNELIEPGMRVGTHCNAGSLAFVNWGSALAVIYAAHRAGKKITVYADETRPRSQGARLTAWELQQEGVPHFIVPDNAVAHLMAQDMLDMFIVGADRIAGNGDVANKIGTLEKAILANRYGVPFYVAAPTSTFDLKCRTGADIPIEQRSEDEVLYQTGINQNGDLERILVCSPGSHAINPAFDVTPHDLISGIITQKGIIDAYKDSIKELFE